MIDRISELSDSESDEEEEEDSDSDDEPVKQFSFPQLDAEIRSVLSRYDGAVFPKLNWSSPQVCQSFSAKFGLTLCTTSNELKPDSLICAGRSLDDSGTESQMSKSSRCLPIAQVE